MGNVAVLAAVLILVCAVAMAGQPEGSKGDKPAGPTARPAAAAAQDSTGSVVGSSESQPLNLGAYEPTDPALDAPATPALPEVGKVAKDKDEPVLVTVGSFIFKLAVVLGLAYASIYALKRFTGLRSAIGGGGRRIKVVENATLGTNRSLHLIEVGQKRLLVASTPSQISLLTELAVEEVDSPASGGGRSGQLTVDSGDADAAQPAGFAKQLTSFMGSRPNTGDGAGNVAQMIRGSSTFLQEKIMQLGRLRRKLKDG